MDLKRAQGWTTEPVRFPVGERLCVPAYARALGLDDPELCRSDAARRRGWSGRPVPPSMYAFFHVVPSDVLTGELGFTWGRTLGAAVDFEADGAATDADELRGASRVEAVWERAGSDGATRQFLRLATDFVDSDGTLVCRNRVLFLERQNRPVNDAFAADGEPPGHAGDHFVPRTPIEPLSVSVGSELPSATLGPVDRLMLARMSVAIDNPDPIHLDDDAARAAGLPGVIGHGTTVAGLLYEPVRRWAGLRRQVAARTTQRRPFGPGAVLTSTGRVVALRPGPENGVATCETSVRDAAGVEIGSGTFDVVVS